MMRMREHVHRSDCSNTVFSGKHGKVAGLRCRIAAYIHNSFGSGFQYDFYHVRMYAGTRRIENYHVRSAVFSYELPGKHVLHVAGEKLAVPDTVVPRVDDRILHGFRDIFYPYYLA